MKACGQWEHAGARRSWLTGCLRLDEVWGWDALSEALSGTGEAPVLPKPELQATCPAVRLVSLASLAATVAEEVADYFGLREECEGFI